MQGKVAVKIDAHNASISIDLERESCGRIRKIDPAKHLVVEKETVLIKVGIAKTTDDITVIIQSYAGAAQDIAGHVNCLECAVQEQEIVNKTAVVREHASNRFAIVDGKQLRAGIALNRVIDRSKPVLVQ